MVWHVKHCHRGEVSKYKLNYTQFMDSNCPYCKKELSKKPSRKTKCPFCKKFIFVRNKILVTEKDSQAIDFRKRMEGMFSNFSEQYLKTKEDLTKKFGFIPHEMDILWGTSQRLLIDAIKNNDWYSAKMIYFEQALLYHYLSKDCFRILQEAKRCELREYQKHGLIKEVEILTCSNSCSSCKKLSGKRLKIEEAFKKMPIPHKDCSFKLNPNAPTGWCRCMYLSVIE